MPNETSAQVIQSLYVAYYGRPADPEGLAFWVQSLEIYDGNVQGLLADFANSPEYAQRFGGMSHAELVNNLYQQLFGRDAEPGGLAFYTGLLDSGQLSLGQIAYTIGSIAEGTDRQIADGRVQAAKAFTNQLDTSAEIAAYGTSRGIEIGKAYLNQITAPAGTDPVIDKVVDVVATLLPATPPPAPGGGGTTPPPAPTFSVQVEDRVLSFAGTQTGPITVDLIDSDVVFSRGTLKFTLTTDQYVDVHTVALGNASVTVPALAVDGLNVTGTGSLTLTGLDATLDLSGIESAVQVTAEVDQDLDITQTTGLDTIDSFNLAADAQLTLTAKQFGSVQISGDGTYALKDDAAALATLLALPDGLQALEDAAQVVVADTVQNLLEGTGLFGYATSIVVTGAVSIAELGDIYKAIEDEDSPAEVVAENLTDTIAKLVPSETIPDINGNPGNEITVVSAHRYVTEGTNVTVTDHATLAQIKLLDDANGDGGLTYSLQDSLANLRAAVLELGSLLSGAETITLTSSVLGTVSVADIQWLLDPQSPVTDGDGNPVELADLTFAVTDTFSNLAAPSAQEILGEADSVTASPAVTVVQAKTLDDLAPAVIYDIHDSAANLATNDGSFLNGITHARNLMASSVATAAEAQIIQGRDGAAGDVTYDVTDTYTNLMANQAGANAATDLTVSWSGDYLSTAQASAIADLNNRGKTELGNIQGTAAEINTFVASKQEDANLRYAFYVEDTAANILTQIGNGDDAARLLFAKGNADAGLAGDQSVSSIHVTSVFDVQGAQDFWNAINPVFGNAGTTASKTYYTVSDTLANYTNAVAAHEGIINADGRVITAATAVEVHEAQNSSLSENHNIFDVLSSGSGTGQDRLIITAGSAGNQSISGTKGNDQLRGGADNDYISGGAGNDTIYGDEGNDTLYGGDGGDTIYGGSGSNAIFGGAGRDTIEAGDSRSVTDDPTFNVSNSVYGGDGGDNLFGSTERDTFYFAGTTREALTAESGTQATTRDYISFFSQDDRITFSGISADQIQFVGTGSSNNATSVAEGSLGLAISYTKGSYPQNWNGTGTEESTLVKIDIADANGHFDNVADMHIVLVGQNIDINMSGNSITFGA